MKYPRDKYLPFLLKASAIFILLNVLTLFSYAVGSPDQDAEAVIEDIVNFESTTPLDGATDVSLTSPIKVSFSGGHISVADSNLISITSENVVEINFTLNAGPHLIINHDPFNPGTKYTVLIEVGALNEYVEDDIKFTFTTEEAPPPTIESTKPEKNTYGVNVSIDLEITFNEPVEIVDMDGFSIYDEAENQVGNIEAYLNLEFVTEKISTATPELDDIIYISHDDFEVNKNYTLLIDGGAVENEHGVANEAFTLEFSTYPSSPPAVTVLTPNDDAEDVPVDGEISVAFDEPIFENELSEVRLYDSLENLVTGVSVTVSGNKLTLSHPALQPETDYFVTISANAIVDEDGIGNEFIYWEFSTEEADPLNVVETIPQNESNGIPIDTDVSVTFDHDIIANNLEEILIGNISNETLVSGISVSISGNKLLISHPDFNFDTEYLVQVPAGAITTSEGAANSLIRWEFRTIAGSHPELVSVQPENGASLVPIDAVVSAQFDNEIFASDLSAISIEDEEGNQVSGIEPTVNSDVLVIEHDNFEFDHTYTVTIPAEVVESNTGLFNSEITWSFTTVPSSPEITSTIPENGSIGIPVDTDITATFDKEIVEQDLTNIEVEDEAGNSLSDISASISGSQLVISNPGLELGTTYTISIGEGTVINNGNVPNEASSWSFTTILSAPEVESTSPEDGQDEVAVDAPVTATFTLPIEAADLEAITIIDEDGQALGGVSASVEDTDLLIDHPDFEPGTTYTVSLGDGVVTNEDGIENEEFSWSFTTILSTPEITGVTPEDGQAGVATQPIIAVEFDQAIEIADASQMQLMGPDQAVENVDIETNSNTLTLSPPQLTNGAEYTVTVGTGTVVNSDGVPNEAFSWSFTTILSAPELSQTAPSDGQTGVALDAEVVVGFNQPVEEAALDDVSITDGDDQELNDISVSVDGSELLIDHPDFEPGTTYTVSLGEGVVENEDGVENEEFSWSFTTILPAPTVVSQIPEPGQAGVEVNPVIRVEFDLPVTLADLAQVALTDSEGESIDDLEAEVNDNVLTITTPQLANGVDYNIVVGSGTVSNIDDIANEALSWDFTTILSAPEVMATKPSQNALAASVEADISILFNQPISEGDFSLVDFTDASDNTVSGMEMTIEDSTLLIQHAGLEHLTDYFVQVFSGAVTNSDQVANEIFQFRFTTVTDISEEVTITVNRDFGDASSPNNYRLIALPGNIQVPLPEVLGSNGGETWQAFWDTGAEENFLIEYEESELFELKPGNGFWLISADPFSYNENIPSVELNELNQAEITLHSGWNIISNPLDVDVGWDTVEEANEEEDLQPLWAFNESFEAASVFKSAKGGEAFYFFNETDIETLLIPYIEHSPEKETSQEATEISITTLVEDEVSSKSELILSREIIPSENLKQIISPPGGFEEASIRFINDDKGDPKSRAKLAAVRYSGYENLGQSFDMVLNTTAGTPVTIAAEYFEGSLTNDELLVLIDKNTGIAYDLSGGNSAEIIPEKDTTELLFVVGTEQYLNNEHAGYLPDEITINQNYPNPFNPTTILSFSIPEKSLVDVAIYNLLGQKVATLVNRSTLSAGAHKLRFDGSGYSSGLYIVRYTVGKQYFNQKVLLIK